MEATAMMDLLGKVTRKTLAFGLRSPGSLPLVRRLRSSSAAIVMYHGVTDQVLSVPSWCQLPVANFTEQIDYLSQHYTPLPLREIVDRLGRRLPLPPRPAAVTFDDGFRNVLTTALPVLQRYQVPATVFLVTSLVGTRQPAWPDRLFLTVAAYPAERLEWQGRTWELRRPVDRMNAYRDLACQLKRLPQLQKEETLRQLTEHLGGYREVTADAPLATLDWNEVEELSRSGLVDFGSHTHTHPILSRCTVAAQETELRTSRDLLRERLGQADLFAYPNGCAEDFTPQTRQLLIDLEYRSAVSTLSGLNTVATDLYGLRRLAVAHDTSLSQFALGLTGLA
jgi:peptidoglycan/xylan/chitin deacetylase (PgdA/CDA1 family)